MPNKKILWIEVWSIAAVQGAITLAWVIYNLYFPMLLVEFGFNRELAVTILLIENAVESIIEPVFGALSDRQQRLKGQKITLILFGIILSSGLFILFPCLVIFSPGQSSASAFRWLLPILAIVWATAMAVFRAPTMSLLGRCAPRDKLPQAASILTLVRGAVGAFRFDTYGIILSLGTGFAFALGSFSLLIAAFVLRRLNPVDNLTREPDEPIKIPILLSSLIFATGIWVAWSLRFTIPTANQFLQFQFGEDYGKTASTIFLILLGLAALPAGKIATKFQNFKTMLIGIAGTIIALGLLPLFPNSILPISLLIIFLSLILNGILPFILSLLPPDKSGLGMGLYFGGFGAGASSFGFIFSRLDIWGFYSNIIGAISCLTLFCFWLMLVKNRSDLTYDRFN
ncbi:MAG: MFS transporter [Cyanobacteria bacterium P01_C01_bin.72]